VGVKSLTNENTAQSSYFVQGIRNKGLSAESGIDAHEDHQIDIIQDPVDRGESCSRIKRYTRKAAAFLDKMNGAV